MTIENVFVEGFHLKYSSLFLRFVVQKQNFSGVSFGMKENGKLFAEKHFNLLLCSWQSIRKVLKFYERNSCAMEDFSFFVESWHFFKLQENRVCCDNCHENLLFSLKNFSFHEILCEIKFRMVFLKTTCRCEWKRRSEKKSGRKAENIDFYDWFMASRVWSGWKGNWVRKLPSWRHFLPVSGGMYNVAVYIFIV